MKTLQTAITIDAEPAAVWAALVDFQRFPDWNPFIREIQGKPQVGKRLEVKLQPPGKKAMRFQPEVLAYTPEKEFRWRGSLGVQGLFDGEHYFLLEALETQKTCLTHGEQFSGLLVNLLWGQLKNPTQQGFEAMNSALKQRVEATISVPAILNTPA